MRTIRDDRGRHWVVTSNTDSKQDSETSHPDGDSVSVDSIWSSNDEDGSDDDDDLSNRE